MGGQRGYSQLGITLYSSIAGLRLSEQTLRGEVRFENCDSLTLDGVTFTGGDSGPTVRIRGCKGFRINGCTFQDAAEDHLYIYDASSHGHIVHSWFCRASRNAISIINGSHIRIEGNVISGVQGAKPEACIDIESNEKDPEGCNHDIAIVGNTFSGAQTGVLIVATRSPHDVSAEGNSFVDCPVAVNASGSGHRIVGNRIRQSSNIAIGVTGDRARIEGNDILGRSDFPGIYVEGVEHLIRNNRVRERLGAKGAIRSVRGGGMSIITGNELGGGTVVAHPDDFVN